MKIGDVVKIKETNERVRIRDIEGSVSTRQYVVESEKFDKGLTTKFEKPRGKYRGHFSEDQLEEVSD